MRKASKKFSARPARRGLDERAFTLIELSVALVIVLTLAAITIPSIEQMLYSTKVSHAVSDISVLELDIGSYYALNSRLPNSLADIGRDTMMDPWGNPYQYLNFANVSGTGPMRKDRFLVPLNSTYDLYSMGKDGQSTPPLTAKASQDDILRANDGGFVGLASAY